MRIPRPRSGRHESRVEPGLRRKRVSWQWQQATAAPSKADGLGALRVRLQRLAEASQKCGLCPAISRWDIAGIFLAARGVAVAKRDFPSLERVGPNHRPCHWLYQGLARRPFPPGAIFFFPLTPQNRPVGAEFITALSTLPRNFFLSTPHPLPFQISPQSFLLLSRESRHHVSSREAEGFGHAGKSPSLQLTIALVSVKSRVRDRKPS